MTQGSGPDERGTAESLVPEEAWELVGQQIGPGRPVTVHANEVERFCRVVGEDNPVFFDEEAGRRSVYGGRPMPPAFALTRFDSGDERSFTVRLPAARRLRGEDELVILRPIRVGERIRARTRLAGIDEKAGRSGPMVLLRFETEYLLPGDEVAMIVRTTIVRR
ncbi:MAG: MaoC family dehydratase N-terminal domain-containing protein [Firmicutes bacterium]|nr:MaoC family dehydratase N-terminal domain-containing protein [Bacillota bacterium]